MRVGPAPKTADQRGAVMGFSQGSPYTSRANPAQSGDAGQGKCDWDTRMHKDYKIIEVNCARRYDRRMVEYHEEQTQEEPFLNHEETPARIVTDTVMPQALASPAGEVEIINLPTTVRNRQSDNKSNRGSNEDTDDEDQDTSDSDPTSNESE
ncbi:hypothetical protein PIB30_080454 [Stylosanthes scabra]|uniref:Uncharacterized protein n=1 Tax=Stylosanthes scabra TaxID=79078 RepID=A0ABU6RS68_9FABA|nr:hypothetical protein [Stylosanthes scabra]